MLNVKEQFLKARNDTHTTDRQTDTYAYTTVQMPPFNGKENIFDELLKIAFLAPSSIFDISVVL